MKKTFWNLLFTFPVFVMLLLLVASTRTLAQEQATEISPSITQNTPETTPAELFQPSAQSTTESPVTSVSELSDVQPTDWAFVALQSLVERYGCIVGYPDSTYRGNRALTRYEFAAGLNACLDQVNKLIASSTAELATKEDLATLQRLQEEFRPELAQLRGKVESLEARTAQLEANQFSTTTKLVGDAIFVVADTFGDTVNNTAADDTEDDTTTFFAYRARLALQTSFNGKDQLTTGLQASNIPNLATSTGTHMTRFTFDKSGAFADSDLYLDRLYYRFPVGDKLTVWVGPRALQPAVHTPTLNPLVGGINGAVSRFATFNPTVYRPGFDGAGAALAYKFSKQFQLNLSYIGDNFQTNVPEIGFSDANNIAFAQLTISPNNELDFGLSYVRKYFASNTGFNLTGGTGSAFARNPFQQNATASDNFGLQFNWKVTNGFNVAGWFGYTLAHQIRGGDNDATIINGALTFAFPDLFREGNVGGFIVGVPPKAISNDFRPNPGADRREDNDTSLHLEAFYSYRVNNNITITPDLYVILNPEHNSDNDPIWVGALRTTFTF
ncbi:iron uptake porin [Chlorogloeopsis sp. ULAP01]|uniref:iron uptake porin n=1 Tax=Chlorogloeopsis sp. ULAP01 TaxID=3056483 RepID=UPI0025AB231A|nr:iron uptake porin [Chlorogloeopsis sp. ULAP01]MDM9384093.1 iron uptake porin [Chlorogloeopsis sp. ULAP01]